ncbi:tetratricopeptide repeat protein [Streptomyces sp. NPDC058385]|uniref:tetratricopeptide repeat protein n=1 Tax=Streptomyces sp. NPDC058385 TaxID=3346473 RepID=UPI00366A5372
MPSLKHLGRESFRIAFSRRLYRVVPLWWRALRSVNKFLLVTAASLVGLAALTATGGDPFRKMTPAVWIVLALALILLAAGFCRSRPVRILPFKNLAGDNGTGPAATVAAGFAELLDSEIRRIAELVRQEPFMTPADVLNPAGQRGEMVRWSSARVPFKTGVAATGLLADIKPTEVGTVTLGPLKLQVGTMLTWVERLFGTTLQGSLVEADGVQQVVASQSGLRGGPTWSAQVRIDADVRRADGRLARELAHRIELERPGAADSGADVDSFQRLVDGLESYQSFQQEGVLQYLDEAEDHFRAALAHSPAYAAAYHNLGLVYREQRRVRAEIGLAVSEAVGSGPVLMWQKAVALDPTLTPARVQLARAFLERADHPGVNADKRAELLEQAVQSARSALKQPSGTHHMEGALAAYWLGEALLKQGDHQQPRKRRGRSDHMVREALCCFRRAERELIEERARRLVLEGDTTAVRPLTGRIAQVVRLESECWLQLAGSASSLVRRYRVMRAKRRVRAAIRWAPELPELHALQGRILLQSGRTGLARLAYMEALQRDPQNHHVTPADLGEFTAMGTKGEAKKLASDLFILNAHKNPDDAMAWLLLAWVAPDMSAARSLAGKALALEPGREDVLWIVDKRWSSPKSTPGTTRWENRFTRRWAQAWADAREAQQTGDKDRLRGALHNVEKLRGEHSRPEVSFIAREIGLLHASLASMIRPSDEERAHWRAAVSHLTKAVEGELPWAVEKPPLWYVELADAHAALADSQSNAGRDGDASDNYEQAISNYSLATERSPKTVRPRYRTRLRGRERFTELTAEQPDLPTRARATAGRAAVYASQGSVGDAVRDCRDALKLAPLYAYPRFTLALLYRDQRAQYDLADETLLRLIELLPAGAQRDLARLELARTYRKQAAASPDGDSGRLLDRAREELIKATREASLSEDLEACMHEELATVLDLLGRASEAIVALRAIDGTLQRPDAAQHHERIAHLMARGEQPCEVERELIAAQEACSARLDRSHGADEEQALRAALVTLKARLAMFYAEQGIQLKKAHRMAKSALKSAPGNLDPGGLAVCEGASGWVAYREGRVREAVPLLEKAVEHSVGDAQEWAHLALALEARSVSRRGHKYKDLDRARDIWQQILEHCPRSPAAEQARHHLDLLPQHLHPPRPLASRGLKVTAHPFAR